MRLPNNISRWAIGLGLSFTLAGCGFLSGIDSAQQALDNPTSNVVDTARGNGPEADFPVVLGEPYKIDGVEITPSDSWNYDEVGYATTEAGAGVTASHKTLPVPSYVEVTSLESGKTALVRVERRGPMTNARLIALSDGAQAQLGIKESDPVRVRRVNPSESERFSLRSGNQAGARIDTPKSLVEVLRRKLPASGSASLASTSSQSGTPKQKPKTPKAPTTPASPQPKITIEPVAHTATRTSTPSNPNASTTQAPKRSRLVVQAAAFSNKASADRVAKDIGGFVLTSNGIHRVRTGPYTSRGQAEAALAKVRADGYKDAKVFTVG